jgi:hypothetical protein
MTFRLTALPPVVLCLVLAGCGSRDDAPAADGDGIPARYQPFFTGGLDEAEQRTALAGLPYREITLARDPCFGPCPVYTVTFRRDLSATQVADSGLEPLGASVGEIGLFDYGRLCYAIEALGFAGFKERYAASWTDSATATLTVTGGDGRKVVVSDYGGVGPIRLWALMETIDSLRARIAWKPVVDPATEPGQR